MARAKVHLHHLTTGEMGRSAMARIDLERTRLAAEIQENILPHAIGKGRVRPGTNYRGTTASNAQARLIPFVKSNDDTALLELTQQKLRFWVGDNLVTRTPVTSTVTNGTFAKASAINISISISSPAVVTWTAHGLSVGDYITFSTTGALPTGISSNLTYYVLTVLSANTFRIAVAFPYETGVAINTSGTQSGVHTGNLGWSCITTDGAISDISNSQLTLRARAGGRATARQVVRSFSPEVEHGLNIRVSRGSVYLRVGSTSGGDDYIAETALGVGYHNLAFTPSFLYYISLHTEAPTVTYVPNCTVAAGGTLSLDAPWATAHLRQISYDQSGDIVFLAHPNWPPQKVERRGPTSWSLVEYRSVDGPFTLARTAQVKLTPGATQGDTTLTASSAFFRPEHVGALFKLTHPTWNPTFNLAGDGVFTKPFKASGVNDTVAGTFNDRLVAYNIQGTWSGTLTMQRSVEGAETGFKDFRINESVTTTTFTVNTSGLTHDAPAANNLEVWYRIGFKQGGYSSGVATVTWLYRGTGGTGICRVEAYNSATSVNISILSDFADTDATDDWLEGDWSDVRGWPSAVRFFDGRLWFAGVDKFWASVSDDYYSFSLDVDGDSGSIQRSIATGGAVNRVRWMLPLQRLIFGTDAAEVSARSSSFDEPLTPNNVTLKDASTQGTALVQPVKLDSRGIYVQRAGNKLFEIVYNIESNDYTSAHLTRYNDEIGSGGFIELAIQRQPESYVWAVRADGQVPLLIYDPAEQVVGWSRFITDGASGDVESVAVLPGTTQDAVYFVVKRVINGSTVRYVEKLARHSEAVGGVTNFMADSNITVAGPVSSVTAAHLASQTGLVAWATDGSGNRVALTGLSANGSGVVALGATYTSICLGLPYSWRYKSAKLAYGLEGGGALLEKKRIAQIGLLLERTHPNAIRYGPSFSQNYAMPRLERGKAVDTTDAQLVYDEVSFPFAGGWDTDSRICLSGSAPYPATILGIVIKMETEEK